MKIFINPGHTPQSDIDAGVDWDCGAVGYGLQENIIAANIGKLTAKYLSAIDCELKVFQSMALEEIVDVSNYWDADLFVSIHCNAANGTARGVETYHYYNSRYGTILAAFIQKQLAEAIPTVNRGVREAGFYVIKYTNAPAVLVETAFIDNYSDNLILKNNQDEIARAIARGITDYIK